MPEVKASGRVASPQPHCPEGPAQERVWSAGGCFPRSLSPQCSAQPLPCGTGLSVPGPWAPRGLPAGGWKGQHLGGSMPCSALELFKSHICFPENVLPFPKSCGWARCMCVCWLTGQSHLDCVAFSREDTGSGFWSNENPAHVERTCLFG
uniref:Uncharacterized protein n=1 Tax=Myotis myotis TaxID=51298 RepID=A0A7J7TTN0_MYOMY|nr:hypothetical protein mMyoMyo1_008922 [Myotis myotis]